MKSEKIILTQVELEAIKGGISLGNGIMSSSILSSVDLLADCTGRASCGDGCRDGCKDGCKDGCHTGQKIPTTSVTVSSFTLR